MLSRPSETTRSTPPTRDPTERVAGGHKIESVGHVTLRHDTRFFYTAQRNATRVSSNWSEHRRRSGAKALAEPKSFHLADIKAHASVTADTRDHAVLLRTC